MISVEEALPLVLQHTLVLQTEVAPLLQSVGRVLAQDVTADRDFPPFDRVTMDGIALRSETFASGTRSFPIEQIQPAGAPQTILQQAKNCIEVMTGAMLPKETDAVVRYEDCTLQDGVAVVEIDQILPGQNIHRQGSDKKAGEVLLAAGVKITPAIVGTLASVGLAKVKVYQLPRIAICSTGDELVEIGQTPLPHQIRRSNAYMLAAALLQESIKPTLFHLPDEPAQMLQILGSLLAEHEVLILSGAVSKGKFDYLPQVLEELGLKPLFHKVAQKPGKPMLFGTFPGPKVVFGLPGNPISTFVCFHFFFRPWLHASLGLKAEERTAQLTQCITFKPALTYHVPVKLQVEQGTLKATPIPSTGSGDLTSILEADGLLSLPAKKGVFLPGESFPLILLS
ncbi:molybdopterin molybdotransferase MoeA [Rufibacter latericius]|uniref:Molybdopterin molybdenumtransferase n=1 Tax=Rufibacter latericius TaxID=2487040 RepID=A0A3M9MYN3_9BACT|nr:molybdopterin molybdotransferase MoeA [Rufibacter latericius]RNI30586.1 molybdopterin molybdenumtransferase MoeA [Rufibacter latericius]